MENKLLFKQPDFLFYLLLTVILFISYKANAQTFPAGFSQVKIGTVYYPTAMAFAPDGRLFVTEKGGKVKIVKNGAVLQTPFYAVTVDDLNERGLGGIAIDPNFNSNHYVYIYYTSNSGTIHNRLSRVTANGDVAVAGSEVTIYDFGTSINSIHNGGGMEWGADGTLYLAVGNDNVNSNSQDLDTYKGKVLRINNDFSVPAGNPFNSSETAKRIWAYGLRNPWSLAIQPGTGKLFVNDVGEGAWEEINDATSPGKNFGWPASQGNTNNPAYTSPFYTYPHAAGTDGGCAITGGTFFNPPSSNFPAQYTGKYFFIDYCNDWINYLDVSTATKYNFATGLPGSGNYIKTGPDGNLYFFSITLDALYKIIYSPGNAPPVVTNDPVSTTVALGQQATFNVSASGATPLTYKWKKAGTDITGAPNSATYTISNVQLSDAGQYSVDVSNTFGNALSKAATLTVSNSKKPTATILTPSVGALYRNGDIISFSGNATDPEDGVLPASAFKWTAEFHHEQHNHPGPSISPGIKNGTFSATFGETSPAVFFRLILVVTDSHGLTDSAVTDIHPVTSKLTLTSVPSGLTLLLEGQPHVTPYTVSTVSGLPRSLDLNSPQTLIDTDYIFNSWSHGGLITQTVTTTDRDTTYNANFKASASDIIDLAKSTEINVYPNPASGQFTIMLSMKERKEKNVQVILINTLGQEMYKKEFSIKNNLLKETVKLDGELRPGAYTLQIIIGNEVTNKSLLLLK